MPVPPAQLDRTAGGTADGQRCSVRENRTRLSAILAKGLAHDCNNLLLPILVHACGIRDELSPEHPWYHALCAIVNGAERAAGLNRLTLDFVLADMQGPRPLHLGVAVRESLPLARIALLKKVEVLLDDPHGDDCVLADQSVVPQLVLNALLGCAQHTPRGEKLRICIADCPVGPAGTKVAGHPCVALTIRPNSNYSDHSQTARCCAVEFEAEPGLAAIAAVFQGHPGDVCMEPNRGAGTTVTMYFSKPGSRAAVFQQ